MHKIYWVHLVKMSIDNILGTVYNIATRSNKTDLNSKVGIAQSFPTATGGG